MAAGDDARTPYTAGTAPDFYLDAEIARIDGTATVLIARSRASIVGTVPVQITNPQATVTLGATAFTVVGLPTVTQSNPQATVTLANPAAAPLATVAIGTQLLATQFVVPPATVSIATVAGLPTVTLSNPAAAPLATVAIGTYNPPATVSVATLAFPNLTVLGSVISAGGSVWIGNTAAGAAFVQGSVISAGGTVSVATVAGLPTVSVATLAGLGSVAAVVSGTVVLAPYTPATAVVRVESWRTMARPSAVAQNLFAVYNGSPSRTLGLYSLTAQVDYAALGMASVPNFMLRAHRITAAPTLGADITARKYVTDSARSSDASVIVRTDAGSDTTIAASVLQASVIGAAGSAPFAQVFPQKVWTLAGIDPTPDIYLVNPADFNPINPPPPFRPGEGFVVRIDGIATTAQIPSTVNYSFEAIWTEYNA